MRNEEKDQIQEDLIFKNCIENNINDADYEQYVKNFKEKTIL